MALPDRIPWRVRLLRGLVRRVPRGHYSIVAALAPSRGRFVARLAADLGAARFECDLSDALSREVCFTGLYEPPVTRVFQRHVPAGAAVVDAGANWGYFTLIAAALAGRDGKVIGLEPDPRHAAALMRNLELNAFTHAQALAAAASSTAGNVTLAGYDDNATNRGVSRVVSTADAAGGPHFEVPSLTIDALTAAAPAVHLVKLDVEGAEDLALQGMRDGLSVRRYRAVLLELHPALLRARGVDPESCVRLLCDYGYRGFTIDVSPAAYRRAIDPAVPLESLLRPLDDWRTVAWSHLLWLC